ncbi:hypothetical protein ABZ894_14830 [Nocardia beijingensis]|uniref:hypothetical protein n=1 Tax=Nocardia beijingensis TaxID=95162 RepID=UPI0033DD7754
MTLIISAYAYEHILHASDRLTVVPRGGAYEDHDVIANKTVIVVGTDCWLVLGFANLAYLDGKPTDQFIAEAISGTPDLSNAMMLMRPNRLALHYQEICERLVRAVTEAYRRLPSNHRKHRLIVTGAGIQFTRPRTKNLLFQIDFVNGDYVFNDGSPDYSKTTEIGVLPAGWLDQGIMARTRERLRTEGAESADAFRSILVDAVKETGKATDSVGESALSAILIPRERRIKIHFDLEESSTAEVWSPKDRDTPHKLEVYTPFAIFPTCIFCPSVASVGAWVGDGISYEFHGDVPKVGGGSMGTHPRKPPPKR